MDVLGTRRPLHYRYCGCRAKTHRLPFDSPRVAAPLLYGWCVAKVNQRSSFRNAIHEVDLVISDPPLDPSIRIRAFSHLLGQSGLSFFGDPRIARQEKGRFPKCLDGMPFLMPAENTDLRRSLEHWFDSQGVHPMVAGEFEDSAMTVVFLEAAIGAFAAPTPTEAQVKRQYRLSLLGRTKDIVENF